MSSVEQNQFCPVAAGFRKGVRAFSILLALSVVGIAGTIEVLNISAGGFLPSREYRNGNPAEGIVKWRQSPLTSEKDWLRFKGPRTVDGTPVARPLSPSERAQMERDIKTAQAQNALRDVVSTAGLIQYLLVPTLFFFSMASWRAEFRSKWVIAQFIIATGAAFLMFYRGYFSSLGW